MNNSHNITIEQLQQLINYLQQKPYCEVHELISMILKIANNSEVK
jgi:hypothetical protein